MQSKIKSSLYYFILLFLLGSFLLNLPILSSRYHYQKGIGLIQSEQLDKAEEELSLAYNRLPFKTLIQSVTTDEQRIATALGNLFFEKANAAEKLLGALGELRKSSAWFQQAVSLNGYDYSAAYGLANTVVALHYLHNLVIPDRINLYDAAAYYKKALELRPNSIATYMRFTEYLAETDNVEMLAGVIQKLISLSPSTYNTLRKQKYYSEMYYGSVRKGLQNALKNESTVRDAYLALTLLAQDENDRDQAVKFYSAAMALDPEGNSGSNYFTYGRLLLAADRDEEALQEFIKALMKSANHDKMINSVCNVYRQAKKYNSLAELYTKAESKLRLSQLFDICLAGNLADAGQDDLAIARLNRVDDKKYFGEKFYTLNRIYVTRKDWDNAELAIQRATVYEPDNSRYYYEFAKTLLRQNKLSQAEQALNHAVKYSEKPNQWYLLQRGQVRYRLKKYNEALADYLKAVSLGEDNAVFYYHASTAFSSLGNIDSALKFAMKAFELAPDNETYKDHMKAMKKEGADE